MGIMLKPIAAVAAFYIFVTISFSMLDPFYPPYAESKGVHSTQYSYFFSVYKIGMICGSVSTGWLAAKLKTQKLLILSTVLVLIFNLSLVSFYWINDASWFFAMCIIFSLIGGYGTGLFFSVQYGFLLDMFPKHIGFVIAGVEIGYGASAALGSYICGLLLQFFDIRIPLAILATILTVLNICTNPIEFDKPANKSEDSSDNHKIENYSMNFQNPVFLIDMITVMLTWVTVSFNAPTLEPYFADVLNLNSEQVGQLFMMDQLSYSVGTLIAGFVWYKKFTEIYTTLSLLGIGISYLLVGPASFIPLQPSIGLVRAAQTIRGFSLGGIFVGGFSHAVKTLVNTGHTENIQTMNFVSSSTIFFLVVGGAATSPIAAYITDLFGFRTSCTCMVVLFICWALISSSLVFLEYSKGYMCSKGNLKKYLQL